MDAEKIQKAIDALNNSRNEEILKLREDIVELSKNDVQTRELLDKLIEKEIEKHNDESFYHVEQNNVISTKDFEEYSISSLTNGYSIRYKGGYTIFVDDRFTTTTSALQSIMMGTPTDPNIDKEDKDIIELSNSAMEMVFRLPLFVFSNPPTTFNIATMGTSYLLYLQKTGEVPTADTDNPEYDKFLIQMSEIVENLSQGLEKEATEYEKRNSITNDEKTKSKSESEDKTNEKA